MRVEDWLKAATEDATRRGLPELVPMLETLARTTVVLRGADKAARAEATDAASATAHLGNRTDSAR